MEVYMTGSFYDNDTFFENYKQLRESIYNANDKVERPHFQKLLPSIKDKIVLDLGCGMGDYVLQMALNAKLIDAVDSSGKMLEVLNDRLKKKSVTNVRVIKSSIEDFNFKKKYYDLVISTLALHYISDLNKLFGAINTSLKEKGLFIFSVEHPTLTSTRNIGWEKDSSGNYKHWRLDNYFEPGERVYEWLGTSVTKYHRTFEDYYHLLISNGFEIQDIREPKPSLEDISLDKELEGHYRRPIILMFSVRKK